MNIIKVLLVSFSLVFFLSGCGGGGGGSTSNNSTSTALTVVLAPSTQEIIKNSEEFDVEVRVFDSNNTTYKSGSVKLIYPSDVVNGRDVGQFAASEVPLTNGVAIFKYKGPSDIKLNDSDIVFKFFHEDDPTNIKNYTVKIDNSQAILLSHKLYLDYGTDVNMNLESSKEVRFGVKDDNDVILDNSRIESITVNLKNPNLAILKDTFNNSGVSLKINNQNNVLVEITTNTISGIMPLEVIASFRDANGVLHSLTKVFNLLVLSGPPSAISLNYVSSSNEKNIAKFKEKWVATVTDKYNNFVNTKPSVSMGLIAGFAKSSATTSSNNQDYLYYKTGGTINSTTDTFTSVASAFSNVDFANDTLVTFGSGFTYSASGKWDVTKNSSSVLNLVDNFTGSITSGLGFAVGHNNRQVICENGEEAVANVEPVEGKFFVDENTGSIVLDISYDYYLVGKNAMLWVNLIGQDSNNADVKIGEAKKITFRASGLDSEKKSYVIGQTGVVRLNVKIKDTVEYYRNGNFDYAVEAPDDLNWSISKTYMNLNDVSSCDNRGVAYVDVNIDDPAVTAGEISLVKVLVTDEF